MATPEEIKQLGADIKARSEAQGKAPGEIAKGIVRSGLRFAISAGEAIPRILLPSARNVSLPEYNIPGFSRFVGPVRSIQSEQVERLNRGESPLGAGAKAVGSTILEEPLGVTLKPAFFAIGAIGKQFVKKAGPKTLETVFETIAKSDSPQIIEQNLKRIVNGSDEVIRPLAERLVIVGDKELVAQEIRQAFGKDRGFIQSVKDVPDKIVGKEIKEKLIGKYIPLNNKATLREAEQLVATNIDEAFKVARSEGSSAYGNAVSQSIIRELSAQADAVRPQYPEAAKEINERAIDFIESFARKTTSQAQALQSLNLLSKLSPEGSVVFAQRLINQANKSTGTSLKLSAEKVGEISAQARKVQALEEGEEKLVQTGVLLKKIHDLIPSTLGKKVSLIQTFAQLLNPKTFARNIIGNVGFAGVENISDVVATAFDRPISFLTGKRTTALPSLKIQAKSFGEGFRKGIRDAMLGINTAPGATQFDLPNTPVFKGGVGKALEKILNVSMRAPDRAFFQSAYDNALYKQMKAAGVEVPTEGMKEVAIHEGLYRTFQDENLISRLFVDLKRTLNLRQDFGLGDLLLKYPKTPANLLSRGLAYSPLGFFNTVMELARPLMGKGKFLQKRFVESTARATVGTGMLFGIGATLHKLGIITSQKEEDVDAAAFNRESGFGQYRLNLSALKRFALSWEPDEAKARNKDTIVSYDWFQPSAISMALGADFDKNKGTTTSFLGTFLDALNAGVTTLQEQPLVSGITRFAEQRDLGKAIVNTIQNIPASFMPTILNQVKQLMDNQQRNTYDPNPMQYSINLAKNRLPFASETLPPKVGVFGTNLETYPEGSNNFFNVLFNPAFVAHYNLTPEAKMVIDLFNESGETKQFPRVVSKKYKINGVDKELTPNQIEKLQRYVGTVTRETFAGYANNPGFDKLSNEKKVDELSSLLTAIGQAGRILVLGDRPKKVQGKTLQLIKRFHEINPKTQ